MGFWLSELLRCSRATRSSWELLKHVEEWRPDPFPRKSVIFPSQKASKTGFFDVLHARKQRDIPTLSEKSGMAMSQSKGGISSSGRRFFTKGVTRQVCGFFLVHERSPFALYLLCIIFIIGHVSKMLHEGSISYATNEMYW